jgi:hypothetical protein
VLERKLNTLLERLEIPKIDIKLLAKFVGKDRTIEQATRSEKRAASVGLHSFVTQMPRQWTPWASPTRFASSVWVTAAAMGQTITRTLSPMMSGTRQENLVNFSAQDGLRLTREK